jgi:hypothetical protein
MSSLSAGKIQVENLSVAGLEAGSIQATNLDFNNLHVSDVLSLDASGDILNIKVKGVPLTLSTSLMGDLLATTQSGRTTLAKSLNYGYNKPLFDLMHYIELLDAGYSGKGVSLGHFESQVDFRDQMLRHVLNPRTVVPTGTVNAQYWQMVNNSQNMRTSQGLHTQCTLALACGFDLHAKVSSSRLSPWPIINPDGFVMNPAYNADVTSLTWIDSNYSTDFNFDGMVNDDEFVELLEKMWAQDVKVASASLSVYELVNDYYNIENTSIEHDGISNVVSYMISLCADHDLVWCNSGGNNMISEATDYPDLKVLDSDSNVIGYMAYMGDARNMLSVGSTRFNYLIDGVQYDYAAVKYYKKVDDSGNITYYTSEPDGEYTREVLPYSTFGTTTDGRIKPDILSAFDARYDYMAYRRDEPTNYYGPDKYIYYPFTSPATSPACPRIAAGVCLLREALPKLDAHQIRECVMRSASHGTAPVTTGAGYGLINAAAALAYGQARPNTMPPSFEAGNWFPKSVQSQKFVADPAGDAEYQAAYADYEAAYDEYVASAPSAWSGAVLDESPEPGLFGSSGRAMNVDGTFDIKKAKSWICCAEADMEELKNLMTTNGIKVGYTSKSLGAFSVTADSVDQLKAVVNGNTLIRDVKPSQKLKIVSGWETSKEIEA